MRKGLFVSAFLAALTITTDGARAGGQVYALRGLINVFSYGMDSMVDRCKKRGIPASAHGHGEYPELAIQAAKLAKSGKGPIIIMGHSYGADAAVSMAEEMKKLGAPVALLVLYGPTIDPLPIPSNVRSVMNFYQTTTATWRAKAVPGPGFRGTINNINLDKFDDVTHFNIEKLDRLQLQAMARIVSIAGTGRPIPTDTAAVTTTTSADATITTVAAPPNRSAAVSSRANGATPAPAKPAASSKRSASSSKTTVDTPQAHNSF